LTEKEQRAQFQQWLPFYINGRLNTQDRTWMERYLSDHPQATVEVQIEQSLKHALQAELPQFSPDHGLADFMARLRTESGLSETPKPGSAWRRWLMRCRESIANLSPKPAWAMTLTLLFVQTGIIALLIANRSVPLINSESEWRSVQNNASIQGPVLQITFKATATEEEIRMLLVKIRGSLVGGPGQLGRYIVSVPSEEMEQAKKSVQSSSIIESSDVFPEPPVEP
jgi:anti-sigma factor RsiW